MVTRKSLNAKKLLLGYEKLDVQVKGRCCTVLNTNKSVAPGVDHG